MNFVGLDATVMCTCFADGLCEPPPFAEKIIVDQEGYLSLDIPWEGNQDKYSALHGWMAHACEHPQMEAADERISNWTGYRSFRQALEEIGWDHFPTLKAELPQANGGCTSSLSAEAILRELDYFVEHSRPTRSVVLMDVDSGETLHEYVAAYQGVFSWSASGEDLGVDTAGFFIRRRRTLWGRTFSSEVFRSMRFTQTLRQPRSLWGLRREEIEYCDLESGRRYRCHARVNRAVRGPKGQLQNEEGKYRFELPAQLQVITRDKAASEYEYILDPLRTVCEASIRTGNPIRWC
ncbi:MAG TPA: hypothetical protein VEZ90_15765 [Blastocatellia bacterium]|nr:hypothetical protein [Blastocatellia bacterium]